ncbi:MAG: copper chaperone PCu(A)C [Magnetococcales bacterium]|nr:copper chaperone PCu(A)C [Magnetococcales bacterium]
MKKISIFPMMLLSLVLSFQAWAGEGIRIENPWIRAAPPSVQAMAAYMGIENTGSVPMTLVAVTSPAFLKIELHETVVVNGMAGMVARKDMVIAPGKRLTLEPGGHHLMLLTPQKTIREGDMIPLTLAFGDGGKIDIEVPVKMDGASSAGHASGHGGH